MKKDDRYGSEKYEYFLFTLLIYPKYICWVTFGLGQTSLRLIFSFKNQIGSRVIGSRSVKDNIKIIKENLGYFMCEYTCVTITLLVRFNKIL